MFAGLRSSWTRVSGYLDRAAAKGVGDREREVLELIAAGDDNAAIASQLLISAKTVANNVSNILVKLHLRDRAHAVAAARDAGLGSGSRPPRWPI